MFKDRPIVNDTPTQPPWSTIRVTNSVIHRSTNMKAHSTQKTVATVKTTMTRAGTDEKNLSIPLLQYISNVS